MRITKVDLETIPLYCLLIERRYVQVLVFMIALIVGSHGGYSQTFVSHEIPPGTNNLNSGFDRMFEGNYHGWEIIDLGITGAPGSTDMANHQYLDWLTQGGIMIDGGDLNGRVTKLISTIPGQSYDFVVYHTYHPGKINFAGTSYGKIEILNGAAVLASSNVSSTIPTTQPVWHEEVVSFTATSTLTTLALEQTNPNNDGYGSVFSGMKLANTCEAPPAPISGGDQSDCDGATVPSLSVSSSATTVNWYDSSTKDNLLHTGLTFTPSGAQLPAVGATRTYYVEAVKNCTANLT